MLKRIMKVHKYDVTEALEKVSNIIIRLALQGLVGLLLENANVAYLYITDNSILWAESALRKAKAFNFPSKNQQVGTALDVALPQKQHEQNDALKAFLDANSILWNSQAVYSTPLQKIISLKFNPKKQFYAHSPQL